MDNLIGDDIDVGVRQVVRQLLNLASDPDSQVLMAQQPEFIPGLVGYMSNEDIEVRLMAARAIEFLSTHPNNKDIIARSPGLVPKMKELADSENEHARAISRRTLYNIKNFLPSEDVTFVKEHPIDSMPDVKQGVTTVKTYTFSVGTADLFDSSLRVHQIHKCWKTCSLLLLKSQELPLLPLRRFVSCLVITGSRRKKLWSQCVRWREIIKSGKSKTQLSFVLMRV